MEQTDNTHRRPGCKLNLAGKRFGRLTAIRPGAHKSRKSAWFCLCDCGRDTVVITDRLTRGRNKSCGWCLITRGNITGRVFGRLTVIKLLEQRDKFKKRCWECLCCCGNTINVSTHALIGGNTKSCGCYKIDTIKHHGLCKTRVYRIWSGMWERCTNKYLPNYDRYGGRGITVCDRWKSFENFFEDMGHPPDGFSIDRINNDDGYYKENCRWATRKQQLRNTCRNNMITFRGETKCITDWASETGIEIYAISWRIKRGWSIEDALTRPVKHIKRKTAPPI